MINLGKTIPILVTTVSRQALDIACKTLNLQGKNSTTFVQEQRIQEIGTSAHSMESFFTIPTFYCLMVLRAK